jgi:hypothetical protein
LRALNSVEHHPVYHHQKVMNIKPFAYKRH